MSCGNGPAVFKDVVKYLETLLADNDYITDSAPNGRAGLEKARRERPDLVLLDLSTPEKSGVEFCRELKADPDLESIPVIIVTAVIRTDSSDSWKARRSTWRPRRGIYPSPSIEKSC